MLIERQLEEKVATAIETELQGLGVEIVASRDPAAAGYVKGEHDTSAVAFVAIASGLRQCDDFSLPTVNIGFTISISTRAEMDPTGAAHETILETIMEKLTAWHNDGASFSAACSFSGFFAAELRMDGGGSKSFVDQSSAWQESFSFTIRGTIVPATNN